MDDVVTASAERTPSVGWVLASLGALHAAALPRYQHRQCRTADAGRGVCRIVSASPMGRARLPAGHHDVDRQRRTARRHHGPSAAADGRHLPVHGGLRAVWRRVGTRAVDCRPRSAGSRSGRHDGPHHGVRRRDSSEAKDRQRHGAARDNVGGGHRSRSFARRRPDRRLRLAGDLLRQRTPGPPGARTRSAPPARRPSSVEGGSGRLRPAWERCCWR